MLIWYMDVKRNVYSVRAEFEVNHRGRFLNAFYKGVRKQKLEKSWSIWDAKAASAPENKD